MNVLNDRKSFWQWIAITAPFILFIPLLIFILAVTVLSSKQYDPDVTNVAFKIGSLSVAWYGIFIFLGFILAIFIGCIKLWKVYKCPIDPFYWYCIMGIPGAILGARFWSCCIGDAQWNSFWSFREGGLAVQGGVILDVIIAMIYFPLILKKPKYQVRDELNEPAVVRQVSMWVYVDAIIPCILIGQVLGRYGNYMNQEVVGGMIDGEYAKFIQNLFPYMYIHDNPNFTGPNGVYQPFFFYESFTNWFGLVFIYFIGELIPKKNCGDLGLGYFLWYGILRTIMNPFRYSQYAFNAGSLTFSIIWLVAAIVLIVLNHTVFPNLRKYKIWQPICNLFRKNKKEDTMRTNEQMLYYLGR